LGGALGEVHGALRMGSEGGRVSKRVRGGDEVKGEGNDVGRVRGQGAPPKKRKDWAGAARGGGPAQWLEEKRVLDRFVAEGLLTAEEAGPRLEALKEAARQWMLEGSALDGLGSGAAAEEGAAAGRGHSAAGREYSAGDTGRTGESPVTSTRARGRGAFKEFKGAEVSSADTLSDPEPLSMLAGVAAIDQEVQLRRAAAGGMWYEVKKLVEGGSVNVNAADEFGRTAVYLACLYGHVDSVKELLKVPGCDVNRQDLDAGNGLGHGFTPLHRACERGHLHVVRVLASHPGLDVNRANWRGDTPLLCAAATGNLPVLRALAALRGINPNQANALGWTPLHLAMSCVHAGDAVKVLLSIPGIHAFPHQPMPGVLGLRAAPFPMAMPVAEHMGKVKGEGDTRKAKRTEQGKALLREQNKRAQARYRQRQKEKAQQLDEKVKHSENLAMENAKLLATIKGLASVNADASVPKYSASSVKAPSTHASTDAPDVKAPSINASTEAPSAEAPGMTAPSTHASTEAPSAEAPSAE